MLPHVVVRAARAGVSALALFAAGSGAAPRGKAVADPPARRYGPGREMIAYIEHEPEAKAVLFRKINEERKAAGLSALEYDVFAAKVGDEFCLDGAANGTTGHWDLEGRSPYLRWALAGGVDYHGQNAGSYSRSGAAIRPAEVVTYLMDAHARMMAERPPDDGHRRTVLNPIWTHVGIGAARVGGEFRMTEEYSRRVAQWVEIPSIPLPAGGTATFTAQLPLDWAVGAIEVAFERTPEPLSMREISVRRSYQYPSPVSRLLPVPDAGLRYPDGSRGDFRVRSGRIDVRIPLRSGPGNYYVLVYAGRGTAFGQRLSSITGALIVGADPEKPQAGSPGKGN